MKTSEELKLSSLIDLQRLVNPETDFFREIAKQIRDLQRKIDPGRNNLFGHVLTVKRPRLVTKNDRLIKVQQFPHQSQL